MIKLERVSRPEVLTQEIVDELTEVYKNDKEKHVWNSPKIKRPLKEALMDSSNNKCVYCEGQIGIEAKDVTIDHFKPKVDHASIVVEWENLVPACLRCNRTKNRKIEDIINPFEIDPKEHLGLHGKKAYHIIPINNSQLGKDTIEVLDLNDIERLKTARLRVVEAIVESLSSEYELIKDGEISVKTIKSIDRKLNRIDKFTPYSAIVASYVLSSDEYIGIKGRFQENNLWNERFRIIENNLTQLALNLIR